MKRHITTPRQDWESTVEADGLLFKDMYGQRYWDESAYYELTDKQVDALDDAAVALHKMCIQAVDHVVKSDALMSDFSIPVHFMDYVRRTWDEQHPHIYGRFDFAYDGVNPPKMLEYNADTPTGLLEASIVQWNWKEDVLPNADQFNSIHETLVERWRRVAAPIAASKLYFASFHDNIEDVITTDYLEATAKEAGIETESIDINMIGWNEATKRIDLPPLGKPIDFAFKLYPWEFMARESGAPCIAENRTAFIEPAWKMILSNKAILPVLWKLFPDHPNLLPAFRSPDVFKLAKMPYVQKPILSREGANITLFDTFGRVAAASDGAYGQEGYVYQKKADMPQYDGNTPVMGVWVVGDKACGLGIREDKGPITTNMSRFVPHIFRPA